MTFLTQFRAIDPRDGALHTWCGPNIEANSWEEAQEWCRNNLGYLVVIGQLISCYGPDSMDERPSIDISLEKATFNMN